MKVIIRRRAIASMYQERLGILDELQLPPGPDADPDHLTSIKIMNYRQIVVTN